MARTTKLTAVAKAVTVFITNNTPLDVADVQNLMGASLSQDGLIATRGFPGGTVKVSSDRYGKFTASITR